VPFASYDTGAKLQVATCDNSNAQTYTLAVKSSVSSNEYEVELKALHSGKCVDVFYAGIADGTPVQQYDCNGTPAQTWITKVINWAPLEVEFKAKHSNKCLDIDKGIGPNVYQWTCIDSANQKYLLTTNFSHWDCYLQTSQLVGRVEIWWGHTSTDGVWACNLWVKECQNSCSTSSTSIPSISPTIGKPETRAWTIMDKIASVVGVASALVAAAFAFAKWKRKMKSTSTSAIPTTVAPSPNMTSSIISTLTPQSAVPQTNVCNTPIPSQQNPTQGPRRSSLGFSRSFSSRI
jgi:hypothetical protein